MYVEMDNGRVFRSVGSFLREYPEAVGYGLGDVVDLADSAAVSAVCSTEQRCVVWPTRDALDSDLDNRAAIGAVRE